MKFAILSGALFGITLVCNPTLGFADTASNCFVIEPGGVISYSGREIPRTTIAKGFKASLLEQRWLPIHVKPEVKWPDFLATLKPLVESFGEEGVRVEFYANPKAKRNAKENFLVEHIFFKEVKLGNNNRDIKWGGRNDLPALQT